MMKIEMIFRYRNTLARPTQLPLSVSSSWMAKMALPVGACFCLGVVVVVVLLFFARAKKGKKEICFTQQVVKFCWCLMRERAGAR